MNLASSTMKFFLLSLPKSMHPISLFSIILYTTTMSEASTNFSRDRLALLSFKSMLSNDPHQSLSSWSQHTSLGFCQWRGVTCDMQLGHQRVTALKLDSLGLIGPISPSLSNLTFLHNLDLSANHLHGSIPPHLGYLPQLHHLNLSSNSLQGEIPTELCLLQTVTKLTLSDNKLTGSIPDSLGNLSSLVFLSISLNNLSGTIPPSVYNISSLVYLALQNNNLSGEISADIGHSLPRLESLYLQHNRFDGNIPVSFGEKLTDLRLAYNELESGGWEFLTALANCSMLSMLWLTHNHLQGFLPSSIANLSTNLEYLGMGENMISGVIPPAINRLVNLKNLYLGNNNLTGGIPPAIGLLPRLQVLALQSNSLSDTIPSSLRNLSQSTSLHLGFNKFRGSIPPSLGNLTFLTVLQLHNNGLEGIIPESLGNLHRLKELLLSFNSLVGSIPPSVWNISALERLVATDNKLTGAIPPETGQALPRLKYMALYGNRFHGALPLSLQNASALVNVQLQNNAFTGKIPPGLGALRDLSLLNLYSNKLEAKDAADWSFFDALVMNCTKLKVLNLMDNKLSGKLPDSISNLSISLEWLVIGQNRISGSLPDEIGNLGGLVVLDLRENLLTGSIPDTIGLLHRLRLLDLMSNKLSGEIPSTIGNITGLVKLRLGTNYFNGEIPASLGNCSLELLDLNHNKLTGSIPGEILSIASLSFYLNLSRNLLTGELPSEVGNLMNLGRLYVSDNRLSGTIPSTIGNCRLLENLYMQGNQFQGSIPSSLQQLRGLSRLDLSSNNLSGELPRFLGRFQLLVLLNLSSNNFNGEVPEEGIFLGQSSSLVLDGNHLCGGNPSLGLPHCSSEDPRRRYALRMLLISTTTLSFILFLFVATAFLRKLRFIRRSGMQSEVKNQHVEIYARFGEHFQVSYDALLRATNGFSTSNLIGVGGSGNVYKGILDSQDETLIAVKVLNPSLQGASKSFMAECDALKTIKHRNLVKLLAACSCCDAFKALVFEYMPNGSLDVWLHPEENNQKDEKELCLIQRLDIAIDVASALEYLHNYGPMAIAHCDIKPSNVLLDHNMNARVGDFGLARFIDASSTQISTTSIQLRGSIGYIAPEYVMTNKASTQADVYSYGIVLLEIFTGKRPTDEIFGYGTGLSKYVEVALPDQVMDIADPHLLVDIEEGRSSENYHKEDDSRRTVECLLSVFKIGLSCIKESPSERMKISDVTKILVATKSRFLSSDMSNEC